MQKIKQKNFTQGHILKQLILYALPLMATNVLQLLFNAADVAVVGVFAGDEPVAAVGATTSLINLCVGLFVGMSVGANVLVARFVGEENEEGVKRVVGSSVLFSLAVGIVLGVVGFFCANTFLTWMDCDPDVIGMATTYLKIYFLGLPIMLLYNYCASILRAVGDALRPFIFLVIGGIANIALNLLFVAGFHKDVEGVAIATVVSQAISAICCIVVLLKGNGYAKLDGEHCRMYKREFLEMLRIGLPAGIQSCAFDVSNVLVQSSVNSFGKTVMTANTVASQIDGFIYQAMNGISLSTLAFVSQNYGAAKMDRVKKTVGISVAVVTVVGIITSALVILLRSVLCGFISDDAEVIAIASKRIVLIGSGYFVIGIMEVFNNATRGMGNSSLAMAVNLTGNCGFRLVWLATVFRSWRTLTSLYLIYPVSWALTCVIALCCYFITLRKTEKRLSKKPQEILPIEE